MDDSSLPLPAVSGVVHYRGPSLHGATPCRYPEHVLSCHLRAEGRYRLGDEELAPRAPFLVLLASGEADHNRLVGEMDAHWCLFRSPGVAAGAGAVRLRVGGETIERSHLRPLTPGEAREAVDLFREMRRHAARPDASGRIAAAARVLDLLALWARPARDGADPTLDEYRALIERHACDDAVALAALARRLGRDPDHLGARFRRAHGLSPMEYRTRARLLRGRAALADGASVADAARAAGLVDARYFARLFRHRYGATPSAFARAARGSR